MEKNLVLLLLLSPFIGFLFNVFFGKKVGKSISGTLGTILVIISFVLSVYFFIQVNQTQNPIQVSFDWISVSNFKLDFGILLDQLSLLWLLFVTGIGSLIHMYSISYMHDDENMHKFFAYLNLFVFFMITLVVGSNLLVMFIGWEGVGLCSYLLIGFWHKNQEYNDAAKKAFIMNRIGDLGFLIGMFILAYCYNSLDYTLIKSGIITTTAVASDSLLSIAALCLFIGACGKSAQLPLYTWLPDAMAGPTPVSALIHAATMVTAGIFMITRLNFIFELTPFVQQIIAVVGASTALVAASIGLLQNDIKKVLAYSTVSQLGLMFLALGMGAYTVAVFHVITHAFFKACLFLGSGSVIHALHGEQDMRKMGGLRKAMPITFATMLISTLAIAGIFPFAGFWSKDEILMVAFEHNKVLWFVGSIASIMTAFYMFRLMYLTFFKEFRGTEEQKHHLHESPSLITLPLVILAALATVGGLINLPGSNWLNHFLEPILATKLEHHSLGSQEYMLMGVALIGAVIGIAWAYSKYIKQSFVPKEDTQILGFSKTIYNKYYVDEFYTFLIVKPINSISNFFRTTLEPALGKVVFSFGSMANGVGKQGKKMQTGSIGLYLFAFVLGVCAIIIYLFLAQKIV
jgi:NADH-quinone oxidoreductase subunit L